MRTFRYILGGVTACVLTAAASHAEQADNRPAKALQDNSFLIEGRWRPFQLGKVSS